MNEQFRLTQVDELIARKRAGHEKLELEGHEAATHSKWLDELEVKLAEAHASSRLPERATGRDSLDDFLVRARMGG